MIYMPGKNFFFQEFSTFSILETHQKVKPAHRSPIHQINHLDPNPAIAARAVFPQSGKRQIFPHFSKENTTENINRI